MTNLKKHGLTIENILKTPEEDIARMIHPVGFWKVCVCVCVCQCMSVYVCICVWGGGWVWVCVSMSLRKCNLVVVAVDVCHN